MWNARGSGAFQLPATIGRGIERRVRLLVSSGRTVSNAGRAVPSVMFSQQFVKTVLTAARVFLRARGGWGGSGVAAREDRTILLANDNVVVVVVVGAGGRGGRGKEEDHIAAMDGIRQR